MRDATGYTTSARLTSSSRLSSVNAPAQPNNKHCRTLDDSGDAHVPLESALDRSEDEENVDHRAPSRNTSIGSNPSPHTIPFPSRDERCTQRRDHRDDFEHILKAAFSGSCSSPLGSNDRIATQPGFVVQKEVFHNPSGKQPNQQPHWVPFSNQPGLKLGNMNNIPTEFIQFLQWQGCLDVPPAHTLDNLLKGYFSHFHPIMPLLDEAEFWAVYKIHPSKAGHSSSISLFLLQAMLAIYCPVRDHQLCSMVCNPADEPV